MKRTITTRANAKSTPKPAPKSKSTAKPARKPKTIAEYIAAAPAPARAKLREMLACIRSAAGGATEELKYGMPAFTGKRILIVVGAFEKHIGLYPSAAAVAKFKSELTHYHHAAGSVQFPLSEPLPKPLIRRMVAFRVQDSIQKDGKWKT